MAKTPEKIGKYKISTLIAQGGMGAVYKAVHPTLNRHVILKKLTLKGNSAIAERFKREARIMMDFKNDHIVDVYDHFKEGTSYYIVLEYIDGAALDTLLKQQRYLPNDVALLIFLEACKALLYAHNKNVIHRDIKPANILLSKEGEVKLVDFGIATSKEDSDEGLTREGMTLGTPSYMAPEQFQNTKNVDNRADIYSMGVMLYEMVTGKKPFPGNFSPESITQIQKGKYKAPVKINPKVSGLIRKLIKKCMHVKPRKRYQTLEQTITLIKKNLKKSSIPAIRERLIRMIAGETVPQAPKKRGATIRGILVAALFTILVIGGAGFFGYLQNYHYEYLWPGQYGAMKISLKIPAELKSDMEDYYLQAKLFVDDNKNIPEVENIKISFQKNEEKSSGKYMIVESQPVYLPSDHYRLKVNIENRVIWSSFFLNPRTVQRQDVNTKNQRIVELDAGNIPSYPVTVLYKVTDQSSGRDLTFATDLYFKINGRYLKWSPELAKTVMSGNLYYFRFTKEGYFTKDFSLRIKPYQNILEINTALIPVPGEVSVKSNAAGIKLLLNGVTFYKSGEEQGKVAQIFPTAAEPANWLLSPGKYELTAGPYKSAKETKYTLSVESGKKSILEINYEKEKKSISFLMK